MSHEKGTYLGAVRDLESLRSRCVIDGGCWHFRTSRGRPMPTDPYKGPHKVWVHGKGAMSLTASAWVFAGNPKVPRVWRTCGSYDCANPKHMRGGSHKEFAQWQHANGRMDTVRRMIAPALAGMKRAKLTPEQVLWVRDAPASQSIPTLAKALGVSKNCVWRARTGKSRRDVAPTAWRYGIDPMKEAA